VALAHHLGLDGGEGVDLRERTLIAAEVVKQAGAQVMVRQHTGVALAHHLGLYGRKGIDFGERVVIATEKIEHACALIPCLQ
jgi:hypothetical protein